EDRELGAVLTGAERGVDRPGVVDEHVERAVAGAEAVSESAYRSQVLEVGQAVADARGAGSPRDPITGSLRAGPVAGQEVDRRTAAGQRGGRRVPDAGGR